MTDRVTRNRTEVKMDAVPGAVVSMSCVSSSLYARESVKVPSGTIEAHHGGAELQWTRGPPQHIAGTDRRIHHMISKGGSEALLTALVNSARSFTPNYTILLPLLHLLAKVGYRDRQIGLKAQKADAVLLVLGLLRQNTENARRAAACLWVLRVFCSSVTTADLLGKNRGLDVVFKLISPHSTKHLRTVKAAVDAFAAMLCSKVNCRTAVAKGYIADLLKLYEDWHNNDVNLKNIPIRRALLHCLQRASNSAVGRDTLVAEGGISLLFQTTQTCLTMKGLESLAEPAIQLMRKWNPKVPLPLTSDKSAFSFPLPGRPVDDWDADLGLTDVSLEDDSDEDAENEEPDNRDYVSVLRFVLEEDVSGTFNTCTHARITILRRNFDRANDVMCTAAKIRANTGRRSETKIFRREVSTDDGSFYRPRCVQNFPQSAHHDYRESWTFLHSPMGRAWELDH
ncbi:cytosolic carboxypeptidase 4-like [Sinocyclocheilus grahami]|uniref:cytosolic carboxypeptidase 4-like n=1 Tax=Sinocyclocheilus grahami TaxID=75366 RepID=UPI0007AC7CAD|nr:PREDICTED: cytosolic carboxypeptidase 4-like [Sinocyclocheilus grahami]